MNTKSSSIRLKHDKSGDWSINLKNVQKDGPPGLKKKDRKKLARKTDKKGLYTRQQYQLYSNFSNGNAPYDNSTADGSIFSYDLLEIGYKCNNSFECQTKCCADNLWGVNTTRYFYQNNTVDGYCSWAITPGCGLYEPKKAA